MINLLSQMAIKIQNKYVNFDTMNFQSKNISKFNRTMM